METYMVNRKRGEEIVPPTQKPRGEKKKKRRNGLVRRVESAIRGKGRGGEKRGTRLMTGEKEEKSGR